MKAYFVYVLRSSKDHNLYTGYTNDLNRRLEERNKGLVPSTKNRIPKLGVLGRMFKSTRCNKTREISQVFVGKEIFEIKTQELSQGVNNPLQWALDEENPANKSNKQP